jgi:hypothetical protein
MRRKRKLWQFALGILSLCALFYLIFKLPPVFPNTIFFFVLIFTSLWFFISFLFKSAIQATLISALLSSYLLIRMLGLVHPLFIALLAILFITLELFFKKR